MSMMRRGAAVCLALVCLCPPAAQSQTVVENLLIAQSPCSGLKTKVIGFTIGVDKLDYVQLPEVDLSLRGDDLHLTASGALGCKTSSEAAVSGDVSATIDISASLTLGTPCQVHDSTARLGNFGGKYAVVLQAVAGDVEARIGSELREGLLSACAKLVQQ